MTLYVVLGDGEMPPKEIPHQLEDLWDKAEAEDQNFWFAMVAKESPTATDLALVKFFNTNSVHYALIVPAGMQASDLYTDVAEYLDVDTLQNGVNFALNGLAEKGESAVVLALFVNVEEDDPADAELIDYVSAALSKGSEVYAFNDSMEPVEIRTENVAPMPEATVTPRQEAPEEVPADEETSADEDVPEPLDKTYLEGLRPAELKELCKGMGISYTNKDEAIARILSYVDLEKLLDEEDRERTEKRDRPLPTESVDVMVLVVAHYPNGMVSKWVPSTSVDPLFK